MIAFVAWVVVAAGLLGFGLRFIGSRGPWMAMLSAVAPWIGFGSWPVVALAAATSKPWLMVAASGAVGGNLASLSRSVRIRRNAPVAETSMRLLSANLRMGNKHVEEVARNAVGLNCDLILFQELTPNGLNQLRDSDIARTHRFRVTDARPGYFGGAIYCRWPIEGCAVDIAGQPMIKATVFAPGRTFTAVNVHVAAPLDRRHFELWRAQLLALRRLIESAEMPVLLAGDFNATEDHREFRRLLRTTGSDAHDLGGSGRGATFPGFGPLPSLLRLDHLIVVGDAAVLSIKTGLVRGSDHRSLIAEVGLT